jgi:O-antigen/teichoic acid export membrane protein
MIARKSALIMVTNILNGIMGYIAIFLVARFMDAPDYALGVVSFAYGFVGLFVIFSNLGFDRSHIKRISEARDLGKCIGTFAFVKLILTGLMTIIVIGSVLTWKYILGRGFESPEHEIAIYVMLVYFVLWSLKQIILTTYKAKREIAKAYIPMLFESIVRVTATIYVVINNQGIIALTFTYVLGELAVLIVALIFFRGYSIKKPSLEYFKSYLKFAIPLAIVVASTRIMTNIDKVLIQLFWNAAEGGNYFAIFRLSNFLDMGTMALGILLFPTMSALYAAKDMKSMKNISWMAERYLSMIIAPIVFFMVFLARPLIHILLSNRFYPAIPILQILPFFALFDALARPYQAKLLGMNLPHFSRNRIIIMVVVNIVLNLLLIPKDIQSLGITLAGLGAVGAAIATVIAYFIGLVYTRITIFKVSGMKFNYRILLHIISAFIMGIVLYNLNYFFQIDRWFDLLIYGFIGIGIYMSLLTIFKEFQKKDFYLLIDTMNIKKMVEYIKKEIGNK